MPISLHAKVMRTADGLDHVNHLCVPSFGVAEFRLQTTEVGAADDKTKSKSYLPEGYKAPEGGADDFHFAPEKESIFIFYKIDDPLQVVTGATLELFRKYDEKSVWTRHLKPDEYTDGSHSLSWDGKIAGAKKDVFPDEYVTVQHSPYGLRLHLTSDGIKGDPEYAWTYFHILIKSIELDMGPVETIPAATIGDEKHLRDKALHKTIKDAGGLSGPDPCQIFLISNLFKNDSKEMDDNTGYEEYEKLWGNGPKIPLIAKIRLADSGDNPVKLEDGPGAKALGKTKFLWDWEDIDEDVSRQSMPPPLSFITDSIDYYKNGTDPRSPSKDHTYPRGDNCHKDRGGKRGPDAVPVFPSQSGYDPKDTLAEGRFPFSVEGCKNRKWAAFSTPWTRGELKGQTGVLFRPSRMAGDSYKISVYLAYEKQRDPKDNKIKVAIDRNNEPLRTADPLKRSTMAFQIWRVLHLSKYYRKDNSISDFFTTGTKLSDSQKYYHECYVKLENTAQAGDKVLLPLADYNQHCERLKKKAKKFILNCAIDSGADHTSTPSMFLVRDHTDFQTEMRAYFSAHRPLDDPDVWMSNNDLDTEAGYSNYLDDQLGDLGEPLVDKLNLLNSARDGITIAEFAYVHSFLLSEIRANGGIPPGFKVTQGIAVDVKYSPRNRKKCLFLFWDPTVDTFVHEIGHHLFLPHAKDAPGWQVLRHDVADTRCVMSYENPIPAFCGLCQLRLRGWDPGPNKPGKTKLDKSSANNKKP